MKGNQKRHTDTENMLQALMAGNGHNFNDDAEENDYYEEDCRQKDATAEMYNHNINFARLSQQTYSQNHPQMDNDDSGEEYDNFDESYALDQSKRQSIDLALNMSNLSNEKQKKKYLQSVMGRASLGQKVPPGVRKGLRGREQAAASNSMDEGKIEDPYRQQKRFSHIQASTKEIKEPKESRASLPLNVAHGSQQRQANLNSSYGNLQGGSNTQGEHSKRRNPTPDHIARKPPPKGGAGRASQMTEKQLLEQRQAQIRRMEEASRAQEDQAQAQKANLINQTLMSQGEKHPPEESPAPQERLSYDEPPKPKKPRQHIQNFEIEQENRREKGGEGGFFHKEASGGVKKRTNLKRKKHADDYKGSSSGSYDLESQEDAKYEKKNRQEELKESQQILFNDLSSIKIYTLAVCFLAGLNLVFVLLFMRVYNLMEITSVFFPASMLAILLCSLFGQLSIIRVEQRHEKLFTKNLNGSFCFEALIVYFKMVIIALPLGLYHCLSTIYNIEMFIAQLEGVYEADDSQKAWATLFGREYSLLPLQQTSRFMAFILSCTTGLMTFFLYLVSRKAKQLGCKQEQARLNDFLQVYTCGVIPLLAVLIFIKMLFQTWYNSPYEHIFKEIYNPEFCTLVMAVCIITILNQIAGQLGGNRDSSVSLNIYIFFQLMAVAVFASQAIFLHQQFALFEKKALSNHNDVGNLVTYIHQKDFNFIVGGIGQYDDSSFASCPPGKYRDQHTATNIDELKCPQRDMVRIKWDDSTTSHKGQTQLACLNIKCLDQFKEWLKILIYSHETLSLLMTFACLMSIRISLQLKSHYSSDKPVFHDEKTGGVSQFAFLSILLLAALYGNFHPTSLKLRTLKKLDRNLDSDLKKLANPKFQILKEEPKSDNNMMAVKPQKFDVLAFQINEDDSLCQQECVPINYTVAVSSIHGNVDINMTQIHQKDSSLFINETKNDLGLNMISFHGKLDEVNYVLNNLQFEPNCPLDVDNIINLKVSGGAANGQEASGQLVSMALGQYKELRGAGETEIFDIPIFQHLARSKMTQVIGKAVDSQFMSPLKNVTVTAHMVGYKCQQRQVTVSEDGQFQMEFPHFRNNYPYMVEMKLTSSDDSYATVTQNVIIGGVLNQPEVYVLIPMNSNHRKSSAVVDYGNQNGMIKN